MYLVGSLCTGSIGRDVDIKVELYDVGPILGRRLRSIRAILKKERIHLAWGRLQTGKPYKKLPIS